MGDDTAGSVEFLSSPDDNPRPKRSRRGNHRWELLVAGLILAGFAFWAKGGHSSAPPATTPSPSVTAPADTADPGPDALRDPALCPAEGSCSTTAKLPTAVADAVRAVFPKAELVPARTVRIIGGGLWFRQFTARTEDLRVTVFVQRPIPAPGQPPSAVMDRSEGLVFVRTHLNGFVVQVQVNTHRTTLPAVSTLQWLAGDPRLLRLD
jgi:hypothetical protein